MLHKALEDAKSLGLIGRNPCDLAHPPRLREARANRAKDKAWTTGQLRAFLEATRDDRLHPIWQLTATTGLRRAEICGLRWSDMDFDRRRLQVDKTLVEVRGEVIHQDDGKSASASRSLALDTATVEVLRSWKRRQAEERLRAGPAWTDTGQLFTRVDGSGLMPKRLSSQFTKVVRAQGLPGIGFHGLRHTYATAALRAGVSPEIVSKRLGHSSVVITLTIYAHVFEQNDEAAAEAVASVILGA